MIEKEVSLFLSRSPLICMRNGSSKMTIIFKFRPLKLVYLHQLPCWPGLNSFRSLFCLRDQGSDLIVQVAT